jgi:Tfp pilus assembly protein PilX
MKLHHGHRGVVLVTVMIFLVVITLFSISMFRSSTTNLRVTGNMQARQEASAAAAVAVEQTLSNDLFATRTDEVMRSPVPVDLNGDGNVDYEASLELNCVRTLPVNGNNCTSTQMLAPDGTSIDVSGCVETDWNIRAKVVDSTTGVDVGVNQGISYQSVTPPAVCPPRN